MAGPDAIPDPGASSRRKGRGRLSTIELLPEEADEAIAWANEQLRDKQLPQTVILAEFNERLADVGLKPISKGAFSRYSVRVAIEARRLDEHRQVTEAILSRLPVSERSDSMIAATELLKLRILEMVMAPGAPDPDLLNVATLSLNRLSTTAQREAKGQRLERKDEREEAALRKAEAAAQATADAVAEIAGEAGQAADPAAVLKRIREDVYGIFER